ncbi:MAG TPA: GntR family transcriptional regulator [Candidatus Rokubacteria bacterium]|nr:GntR family transcriptional regulator [Candidatus Rokubacteria bacterium]
MKVSQPSLAGIRPVESDTLTLRVYRGLRDFLMAGQARPGEKLTLRQLASALGTSPMPVREAVRRLAAEGALDALPNRAIRVPVMTQSRFRELRRIRILLEGLAVAEAPPLITEEALDRLAALNEAFTRELHRKRPDLGRMFRGNKDLHFTVYEAAAMPVLLGTIETFWLQIGPVLLLSLRMRTEDRLRYPGPDCHDRLIKALRARDPAAARAALTDDLMWAGDLILSDGNLPD